MWPYSLTSNNVSFRSRLNKLQFGKPTSRKGRKLEYVHFNCIVTRVRSTWVCDDVVRHRPEKYEIKYIVLNFVLKFLLFIASANKITKKSERDKLT
jgi:hypothetical protein